MDKKAAKIFLIVVVFILGVAAVLLFVKFVLADRNYTSESNKLSFSYPAAWTFSEDPSVANLVSGSNTSLANSNIAISSTSSDSKDVYVVANTTLDAEQDNYKDFDLKSITKVTLAGLDASDTIYTYNDLSANKTMRVEEVLVISQGKLHVLKLTSTDEEFDSAKPDFDKITSSVTLFL